MKEVAQGYECGVTLEKFSDIKEGDIIEIHFGTSSVKVEVLDVAETVKKDEAKELYRYI